MKDILVWKLVITTCPNHADVAGALHINNVKPIQKQGVNVKYSMSEELISENSLLLLVLVNLRGEFKIGIK